MQSDPDTGAPNDDLPLIVVGTVALPPLDNTPIDDGAVVTADTLHSLNQGFDDDPTPVLRFAPGVDVAAAQADLQDELQLSFSALTEAQLPGAVRYVVDSRDVAVAIGVFFVAVGALALVHTMVLTGRRRRHELAVLRTLGLRRWGVGGSSPARRWPSPWWG